MTNKKLNLLFAGAFALVFLIGLASATITLTPSISTLPQTSGSFNLTVSSNQNETINLDIPSLTDTSGKTIIFSSSPASITIDTSSSTFQVVNVTYVVDPSFNFEFAKTFNADLTATGSVSGVASKTLPFVASAFCEYGNLGELKTTISNVKVLDGYGKDSEWFVFDTVEFTVKVKDNGNEDIDNIALEWGLYDVNAKTWAIEVNEEDNFDLSNGDDQTTIIKFTLNDNLDESLADLSKGDYIIYARATGEIADGTNEGDNTCSSDSETGKLIIDRDFVVLADVQVPQVVQCDNEALISANVWNIGSRDQSNVYVNVYNKELGIDENVDVGDIDAFDSTDFSYNLQVPEDVTEKNYPITLTVYDENDDVFQNSNDDKSISTVLLNVQGNCAVAKATVTANLVSGGEAGKPLVVSATITNTGKKTITYSLNAAGYTEWADSVALDKSSLTLNAGQSGEVTLTFNVKKTALGSNLFTLEALSSGQQVVSQPVQVEITKKKFSLGNLFSGDNKYIWGIGLLNLILIILIIVIAVRIARK